MPSTFYILGPTASGKTALSIEVAAACGAEIVGADAFQVYDGLDLLTAKPSREMRGRIRHHLVGEIPLGDSFDVAQYAGTARRRIEEIHGRGRHALVVGGTGLYVRALTHGLADLPPADPALRSELEAAAPGELEARLRQLDPMGATQIDLKNPRRLIRALEVSLLTGKPFSSFRQQWEVKVPGLHGVILTAGRAVLYERIERRTEEMFSQGVVEEVRDAGHLGATAAQAIGVREIHALLAGTMPKQECIGAIQQATRRYAKRQETWFRKETAFEPVELARESDLPKIARQLAARVNAG
ncbi:MAG: tRNA (adenosine(37)-N6)-dimethylallyltransferase MiaA [Verrucomicrobiota bacterium]